RLGRLRVGIFLLDLRVVEDRRPGGQEAAVEEAHPLVVLVGEDLDGLQRLLLLLGELRDAEVPVAQTAGAGLGAVLGWERANRPLLLLDGAVGLVEFAA